MFKKFLKATLSVVLSIAMCLVVCTGAFAASSEKNKYIKEIFLSYGNSDAEAKSYLTDNGYEVLDYNLNEGADDIVSKKRSVYLGYKTTSDADEAITDMKLMNMKGGYSVQDYQMLLDEQKDNIQLFLNNFIIAINEYRNNYNNEKGRAVAAHDLLNIIYEDDTQQYMGDLLLNKIKEEYTDDEWSALSADEQSKVADMTTILMQGNANMILIVEEIIALATDEGDDLWLDRYSIAKSYDDMIDELVENNGITAAEAAKKLSAEYDEDAKIIASKFDDYKTYLEKYSGASVQFTSTEEEYEAFKNNNDDVTVANWYTAGTHYEILAAMKIDDVSLIDLITSDEYDVENKDRTMLYPLVSVLTKGQRACLNFLSMYQIVSCGINGDEAMQEAIEKIDMESLKKNNSSIYEGVDRTIFSGDVALTNEALRLQVSSGKEAVKGATDYISTTSIIFYSLFGASLIATAVSWGLSNTWKSTAESLKASAKALMPQRADYAEATFNSATATDYYNAQYAIDQYDIKINAIDNESANYVTWSKAFRYAGIALTCITIALMVVSLWSTYNDLQEYYNVAFTPIPVHMVDQSTDEIDEKVYTYYNPVKCNRIEKNMVTDSNKLLEDYGDLNGDVGKEWVALYTTTDKAAGDPITAKFLVQYENTNIPNDTVALSMFGESVAQNLTNKKSGYTYSDGKNGIYLFYGTDTSIFAGSVFTNGTYILCGVCITVLCCVATFFIGRKTEKKKYNREQKANA
jgi:hypothetical protein